MGERSELARRRERRLNGSPKSVARASRLAPSLDQLDAVLIGCLSDVELITGDDHSQAGDPSEVSAVQRRHAQPVRESSCGNPEVVRADLLAATREVCPNLGVDACNRLRDGDRVERSENVLNEPSPPGPTRAGGSMNAVEQLADGDHADGPLLVAQKLLEPL